LVGFYNSGLSRALSEYNKVSRNYDEQVNVLATGEKRLSGADFTKAATFEAQARGAGAVKGNMLDVIDMMDVTDSALSVMQTSLGRIRGYYLDGTSGTATTADIDNAQLNINAEVGAIDEISRDTEYNGRRMFFGDGYTNFTIQSGTNQGDNFRMFLRGKSGVAQRGIRVQVFEERGGNDRGTLIENVVGGGYALDETSVGSGNIRAYDNRFYGTTANGTDKIDQMTSNIVRMRSQVAGHRSQAESIFDHMNSYEANMENAVDRIKGINFEAELSKLNDLQIRKEGISALISSVNQSNASILSLLP
jgi:flagellin-like hook-associated protein FlgL